MSEYVLSCCSTADMPEEFFKKRDIKYACFRFYLGDRIYPDDLGRSIAFPEFYERMAQGELTRTSQVNVDEYLNHFEKFLGEGKDVLHLTLSSGISGTINSALIARDELAAKYPVT